MTAVSNADDQQRPRPPPPPPPPPPPFTAAARVNCAPHRVAVDFSGRVSLHILFNSKSALAVSPLRVDSDHRLATSLRCF